MSDSADTQVFFTLLQTDFLSFLAVALETIEPSEIFVPSWHLESISYHLGEAEAGRQRRLIFNLPPRSLKSVTISVAWAAFLLASDPSLKIIVVSATEELARRHATNFRRLVSSDWYRAIAPDFAIADDGNRLLEQRTTLNGYRWASSVGAGITGQGADIIIIDDPNKAQDIYSEPKRQAVNDYYGSTLFSRLNSKAEGIVVLVQQRLHANDLSGFLLESVGWTHVSVPIVAPDAVDYQTGEGDTYRRLAGNVLQPERNTDAVIEEIRATMGSLNFEAQYQQNPVPRDGQIIKLSWLRYYEQLPDNFDLKIASWDTASSISDTADFSVGTVWGRKGKSYYLIDVVRGRYDIPTLRRLIEQTAIEHELDGTYIEDADVGRFLIEEMRRHSKISPIGIKVSGVDKQSRLEAQAIKFEAGQVVFPHYAHWLGPLQAELLAFPSVAHDDQVDSISQALRILSRRTERIPKSEKHVSPLKPKRPRASRSPVTSKYKARDYPGQRSLKGGLQPPLTVSD